jgi:pyruvate dehydrogenase E1 component
VIATLASLAKAGEVKQSVVQEAIDKYRINDINAADPGNTEGSG